MKKSLKTFIALSTVGLALGAAVAVGANQEMEATNAISTGETMYFGLSNNWLYADNTIWAHCYGGDADHDVKLSKVAGKIYSFALPNCTTIIFAKGTEQNIEWSWGQSNAYTVSDLDGGNNYIEADENANWTGFDVGGEGHKGEYRPNIETGKTYLRGTWSGGWADFTKEMTLESENVYKIENVLLSAGNEIKVMQINSGHWAEYKNASDVEGNAGAEFVNNNVQITTTGNYTVRFDSSTNLYTVDEYEDTDLTAAIEFANDFKTEMGKYCPVTGSEEGRVQKDFTDSWSTFNTRFTTTETSGTRNYLKTLDEKTLNDFRERYESIMGDYYSLLSSYNFLEYTPSSERIYGSVVSSNENVNGVSIAIIASAIAAAAVGGYFLVRRARKED